MQLAPMVMKQREGEFYMPRNVGVAEATRVFYALSACKHETER